MSVYVDRMKMPFGRMLMSHLMADTPEELREMARKAGARAAHPAPGHSQRSTWTSPSPRRAEALRLGAVEMDGRKMVELVQARRDADRKTADLMQARHDADRKTADLVQARRDADKKTDIEDAGRRET